MARKRSGKVIDKWKSKKWSEVLAPQELEGKKVAEIVCTELNNLVNRVVSLPLSDLNGKMDRYSIYTTVNLRIKEINGDTSRSEVIGHFMSPAYLKSLARRRRSIIHEVVDVTTKDGRKVRVKSLLVTKDKVSAVVKKNLRMALRAQLIESVKNRNYYDLVKAIFDRKISEEAYKNTNPINPVEAVEVNKMELYEEFKDVQS